MTTLESWLDADDNRNVCEMAGDIAFDAISGYYDARDQPIPTTAEICRDMAKEFAFAFANRVGSGWDLVTPDDNDPAGWLAKKVLWHHGFRVASGSIGFDATIQRL